MPFQGKIQRRNSKLDPILTELIENSRKDSMKMLKVEDNYSNRPEIS